MKLSGSFRDFVSSCFWVDLVVTVVVLLILVVVLKIMFVITCHVP